MPQNFHLSLGVTSLETEIEFFVDVLSAEVKHRDPSGYVNLEWGGTQITLKDNPAGPSHLPNFHFGVNLTLADFDAQAGHILLSHPEVVVAQPIVVEAGTPMERKKMYVKSPTGYLIELKGYQNVSVTF